MTEPAVHFEKEADLLKVCPVGRLDTVTSPMVLDRLKPQLAEISAVVMDFAQVDYISSGGMRMLFAVQEDLAKKGGTLKLIHVNDYIQEIFRLTGMSEMIEIE